MRRQVESWEQAGDQRAIFLRCYWMTTTNLEHAIFEGQFQDSGWITGLLQLFARYYFHALDAYQRQARGLPQVWRYTYDAARLPGFLPLQHLMLGVNAHINYDLVLALTNLLQREWAQLSDEQRLSRHADHTQVNQIIAATLDDVQDQVIERWQPAMSVVDLVLGPLDEWVTSQWIFRWREAVWQNAVRMLNADGAPQREALRRQVSRKALQRAQAILYHPERLID
jgi:hypothetical protein